MGSQNKIKFNDYDGFAEKFKPKLTTDDCYTPPAVFEAVVEWVAKNWDIKTKRIMRPFKPGGDYKSEDYSGDCLVLDNPPFSILGSIIDFYVSRKVPFFLFAPLLTAGGYAKQRDVTIVVQSTPVVYENGAKVLTAFVTNLPSDCRIWVCPELTEMISDTQKKETNHAQVLRYDRHVTSIAKLQKFADVCELKIQKRECLFISQIKGQSIYGGGFLISDACADRLEEAEKKRLEEAEKKRLEEAEKKRLETKVIPLDTQMQYVVDHNLFGK